jgi:hypothetical protein
MRTRSARFYVICQLRAGVAQASPDQLRQVACYSVASWYRDYIAYCGISDDDKKLFAVVFQVGRRKPILKKYLGEASGDDLPDSAYPAPVW